MSLLDFLKPSNPSVPPPGTSAFNSYLRATGSTREEGAAAYASQQAVPPPGTSAYRAYQYYLRHGEKVPSFDNILSGDALDDNNTSSWSYFPSASSLSSSPEDKPLVDYLNADLARHYGMSEVTAYQEALSNTAYQRAVKDMKAAGLNPAVLFGSGRAMPSSASLYASEQSQSVDSSRSYGHGYSRSSKSSNGKLFSSSAYSALSAIGGIVGMAVTKSPGGYYIGSSIVQGSMGFLDAVSRM